MNENLSQQRDRPQMVSCCSEACDGWQANLQLLLWAADNGKCTEIDKNG